MGDDETLLATRPGRVTVWNAATGSEQQTFRDVPDRVALSPDRQWLVAGDPDFGAMQFWNLVTGQSTSTSGHLQGVTDVTCTPDSQLAVSGSRDHAVKLWAIARGEERPIAGRGAGPVDISPDGKSLLFASDDGRLKLWDVATGKPSRTLVEDAKVVRRVAFSPNGRVVACVGDWGFFQFTLRLFDAASGAELSLAGDPLGTVRAFEFHPDGKRLAVASAGRVVTIYELESREPMTTLEEDLADVRSLAWSPNGQWLAIAAGEDGVVVWDVENEVRALVPGGLVPNASVVAFSPDGEFLTCVLSGKQVVQCRMGAGKPVVVDERLSVPGSPLVHLSWAPDGKSLAGVNNAGQLHLWSYAERARLDPHRSSNSPRPPTRTLTLGPPGGILSQITFSPEGRHLLTVNGNGTVYVLRFE
jgi:WD40 repeat protein